MAFIYNLKTNFTEAKKKKTKQKKEAAKICTVFDRSWAQFFFLDLVDILDNCRQNMIYVNSIIYKSDLDKQHSIDQYLYLKKKIQNTDYYSLRTVRRLNPLKPTFYGCIIMYLLWRFGIQHTKFNFYVLPFALPLDKLADVIFCNFFNARTFCTDRENIVAARKVAVMFCFFLTWFF